MYIFDHSGTLTLHEPSGSQLPELDPVSVA